MVVLGGVPGSIALVVGVVGSLVVDDVVGSEVVGSVVG